MQNSHLGRLTALITKHKNKVIYVHQLKQMFRKELGSSYTDKKGYKLIYHLKNKGHLISLKKEIFFVTTPGKPVKEAAVIEDHYREILHHHCMKAFGKRYIGGIKALELKAHQYDIPDQILVINPVKQCSDSVVTNKHLHAKTYTTKSKSLFSSFNKFTFKKKVGKFSFPVACKELAILECLFSYDETTDRYAYEYIKKILKKDDLDLETLEDIMKLGKHHTSVNRLLELLKALRPKLVEPVTKLIKKYSFILSV